MKSLKTFIEAWLIYNVVLVSDVQQSESVVHIHIFTILKTLSLGLLSIEILLYV